MVYALTVKKTPNPKPEMKFTVYYLSRPPRISASGLTVRLPFAEVLGVMFVYAGCIEQAKAAGQDNPPAKYEVPAFVIACYSKASDAKTYAKFNPTTIDGSKTAFDTVLDAPALDPIWIPAAPVTRGPATLADILGHTYSI